MRSKAKWAVAFAVLFGLGGCSYVPDAVNPVSWYRDARGLSKNDDLGKGNNQQNLAEGDNEPYPNLGNVPAAPDNALSAVNRDKLTNSLIADRNNAKYSSDNLHAGSATAAAVALPSAATTAEAQISALPSAPPAGSPSPPPPTAPATPQPATAAATAAPQPQPQPAPPIADNSPPASSPPPAAAASPPRTGPPARGSAAPPAESPITSPTVQNVPEGEPLVPAAPPPTLSPRPEPAPPKQVAAAASQAASPEIAPPAKLAQPASAPAAPSSASSAQTAARRSAVSYHVADVSFAPGSAWLSGALRGTVADIVKLHNQNGGTIRIVGHGEATGSDAAMTGLTLALDRAQAVAVALTDSGVPAKDIAVEAAPVAAGGGHDTPRAEVYIEN